MNKNILFAITIILIILLIWIIGPINTLILTLITYIINIMYIKSKKKYLGGNISDDINENKIIFNNVQKILNSENTPIYTYNDVLYTIPYTSSSNIINFNCHFGQRKLVLNEIQFYSKFSNEKNKTFVIYIGSANGEHTPTIMKMFPELKILMIDPNFHNIDMSYKYVYQNLSNIDSENIQDFIRMEKSSSYKSNLGVKNLRNVSFMFLDSIRPDEKLDVLNAASQYVKMQKETEDTNIAIINKLYLDFSKNYKNLIKEIYQSNERIFIIQDYATTDLIKKIKESINLYGSELNVLMISDIRTKMFGDNPTDLDIIWNNIQQAAFAKIIKAEAFMLKFHPPYEHENKDVKEMIKDIKDINDDKYVDKIDKSKMYNFVIRDIKKLSAYYDIKNIIEGDNYKYFQYKYIYMQPWAPKGSSETRLIITKDLLEKSFINYSSNEWSDKFFYYRFYRMYGYFPSYIDKFKSHKLHYEYDGCMDCCIEIQILSDYLSRNSNDKIINFQDVIKKMENKEFCKNIIELYKKVNDSTYYTLYNNTKCPSHGWLTKKPKEIYIYIYQDYKLIQYKINTVLIKKEKEYKITRKSAGQILIYPFEKTIKLSDKENTSINYIIKYIRFKLNYSSYDDF